MFYFMCVGHDTWGGLKLIRGINIHHHRFLEGHVSFAKEWAMLYEGVLIDMQIFWMFVSRS